MLLLCFRLQSWRTLCFTEFVKIVSLLVVLSGSLHSTHCFHKGPIIPTAYINISASKILKATYQALIAQCLTRKSVSCQWCNLSPGNCKQKLTGEKMKSLKQDVAKVRRLQLKTHGMTTDVNYQTRKRINANYGLSGWSNKSSSKTTMTLNDTISLRQHGCCVDCRDTDTFASRALVVPFGMLKIGWFSAGAMSISSSLPGL